MSAENLAFDLTNPAITSLFFALVYALIRVVGYFVSKKTGGDKAVLADEHASQLRDIAVKVQESGEVVKQITTKVGENSSIMKKLDSAHSVYDSNHVPIWYVPSELMATVRNINTEMTMLNKEIIDTLGEIKGGQTVLVDKLGDLINSQRLMTERLGDLIYKLNKMSD